MRDATVRINCSCSESTKHTHTNTRAAAANRAETLWQLYVRIFVVAVVAAQIRWPFEIWDMRILHAWLIAPICDTPQQVVAAIVAATLQQLPVALHKEAHTKLLALIHTHTHADSLSGCRCYVANLNSAVWRRQCRLQFGLQRDTARLHNPSATLNSLHRREPEFVPSCQLKSAPNRKWYALKTTRELLLIIHRNKNNNNHNSNNNNNNTSNNSS